MINKKEIKYILYSSIFAFIWFILVLPNLIPKLGESSPIIQFFLFYGGIYAVLFVFLKSKIESKTTNIVKSLGFFLIALVMDIWTPAYFVSTKGELVTGAVLGLGSSDYVIGFLLTKFMSGFIVYLVTYLIIPAILLFISAKLLPDFTKNIDG